MNSNDTSGSGLLQELDQTKPFLQQLQHEKSPVVLINTFIVPSGKMNEVLAVWHKDSLIMKSQPGFISAQLHRGIDNSNILINVAVWESTAALRGGFMTTEFQETIQQYPEGTKSYPHILQKIAVQDVCTA